MRVPTYEEAFDIIHQAHTDELGHAKDRVKNKVAINKKWYGVPISAILVYLQLCPSCTAGKRQLNVAKQMPLNMILTESIGHRSQVDLIDMTSSPDPCTGNHWILRYADHLCAYAYVRCLPTKSSANTANALVEILSESIHPTILQSDNGSEFLGQ